MAARASRRSIRPRRHCADTGRECARLAEGRVLFLGKPAQPGNGEVEPPGRGSQLRRVEHGGAEPAGLQLLHGLVDRAPGPAGDGGHLLPV